MQAASTAEGFSFELLYWLIDWLNKSMQLLLHAYFQKKEIHDTHKALMIIIITTTIKFEQ